MSHVPDSSLDHGQPLVYQIRVAGQLGHHWAEWFEGMAITLEDSGETVLTGPVVDQAALYGLLKKVRDLGIPLRSVVCLEPNQADVPNVKSIDPHASKQPGGDT